MRAVLRSLLAISTFGPACLLSTSSGASQTSPTEVITSPGVATSYQLPVSISGESVDPAYSCIGLSPISCTSQVSYGYPGIAEVTANNKVIFAPNASFLGTTSPLIWQVQTDSGLIQTGEVEFGVAQLPKTTPLFFAPNAQVTEAAFYYQLASTGFPLNPSNICLLGATAPKTCAEKLSEPRIGVFQVVAQPGLIAFRPSQKSLKKATPLAYLRITEPWGPVLSIPLEIR